jgi:hypothetical protein
MSDLVNNKMSVVEIEQMKIRPFMRTPSILLMLTAEVLRLACGAVLESTALKSQRMVFLLPPHTSIRRMFEENSGSWSCASTSILVDEQLHVGTDEVVSRPIRQPQPPFCADHTIHQARVVHGYAVAADHRLADEQPIVFDVQV